MSGRGKKAIRNPMLCVTEDILKGNAVFKEGEGGSFQTRFSNSTLILRRKFQGRILSFLFKGVVRFK